MAWDNIRLSEVSSTAIRALSFVFLRWVLAPPVPYIIFTLLPIYLHNFITGYLQGPKQEVLDQVDLVVTETTLKDENGHSAMQVNDKGDLEPVVAEEVALEETITVQNQRINPLKRFLTGAPNPKSLLWSLLTLLTTLSSVGFVADRVYSERYHMADDLSFARVGYVSDNEAKLLIREPDQSKMPVSVEVHIKDPQPPFDNPLWQNAGGVRWTTEETDYTAVVPITLRGSGSKRRTYEWRTSNNHTGEFTTPPAVGHAEESTTGPFTFLSTSCIVPRLPYSPFDHPLAIPGFRHLANVLPTLNAQFMLFLGDFIYADVPRYWGSAVSDYRQKYRHVYASPDWPAVGQNLSWIHTIDDHEIKNDWDGNSTGVYEAAFDPFDHYQAAANPPPAKQAGALVARKGAKYYEFVQGPASFFMMDTRSYRSNNHMSQDNGSKTMLGPEQFEDFMAWLQRPEPKGVKWKIIASSVPFTKNWPVNRDDTWGGFLTERKKILEAMWDVASRGLGVVVLSGDRHEFAATKFPPPEGSQWPETATVWEFSASPLSQFYSPIPTYRQTDNEDIAIKYIYKGNSKFGAITIENLEDREQSSLKYRLFVDGVEAWNTVVLSPPPVVGDKPVAGSIWERLRIGRRD
ncbi:alkaline phosphatase D [Podospora australis]|uniref:Alkaline phosphatase D n=1 Tax=Podospora australis TaxID=1536484 RepID=A0AAN7AMY5_9PEZI|nr:alkaline phosphatase D [Podospora australis]